MKTHELFKDGKIDRNFENRITYGLITVDVDTMYPKGSDFWFESWNPKEHRFNTKIEAQDGAFNAAEEARKAAAEKPSSKVPPSNESAIPPADTSDDVKLDAEDVRKDVTGQLMDHLKAIGIEVHGRDEMERYLSAREKMLGRLSDLQQLKSFIQKYNTPDGRAQLIAGEAQIPFKKDSSITAGRWGKVEYKPSKYDNGRYHLFINSYVVTNMADRELESRLDKISSAIDDDSQSQYGSLYDIQESVRSIRSYHNKDKADKSQRDAIVEQIAAKRYAGVGTDILNVDGALFLIDHYSYDELKERYADSSGRLNIPDSFGYGIRKKYNLAELTKEDINEIVRNIGPDYRNSETRIREVLQGIGVKPGDLSELDVAAALAGRTGDNVAENAGSGGQESQLGDNGSGFNGGQGSRDVSFFTTPEGEVYGFVTPDGQMYLDETVITPEHPMHEYTHLWDRAVKRSRPELWARG